MSTKLHFQNIRQITARARRYDRGNDEAFATLDIEVSAPYSDVELVFFFDDLGLADRLAAAITAALAEPGSPPLLDAAE